MYSQRTSSRRGGRTNRGFSRRPHTSSTSDRPQYAPSHNRSFSRGRQSSSRARSGRVIPTFDPTQFINTNPKAVTEEVFVPQHQFADFAVDTRLKSTLTKLGLNTPTPIQDQVIPKILEGKDVVGLAETGTGKTAAFLIPLIERKREHMREATLILTPTRELALQIAQEERKLAAPYRMYAAICVGGTGIGAQIKQLKMRNQFIIGTPGRIKDLIERGKIRTEDITSVVLDEADRMLDMGFINDMREILGQLPSKRHTLFFSATMDDKTKSLIHEFMHDPVIVSVKKKDVAESIKQDVVRFPHDKKFETLAQLLKEPASTRVIVFGAMKHSVEKLANELNKSGIHSESIHGNKNHNQRQRSLQRFKSGQAKVLVATDVAARGIHVDDVSHVINYDLPQTFEDYVHRIGRTGRGRNPGIALTFVQQ